MALDFHQYPYVHRVPERDDLDPPYAPPLQRQDHWEPDIPMMSVSELKTRLSTALNRTNTTLIPNEHRALREALDKLVKEMSEGLVLIIDDYPVPPILSHVEAIPLGANRGIRGNGGSRTRSYRKKRGGSRNKRSLRKRTLRKLRRRKKTHRK